MVKDHSDSERGNPLPPHRLLFPINIKGFFYMHHSTDRIAHTTTFCYTSREELAGTRNSSMGPPHEGSIFFLMRQKLLIGERSKATTHLSEPPKAPQRLRLERIFSFGMRHLPHLPHLPQCSYGHAMIIVTVR